MWNNAPLAAPSYNNIEQTAPFEVSNNPGIKLYIAVSMVNTTTSVRIKALKPP